MSKITFNITFPDKLAEKVEAMAEETGIVKSNLIRMAVHSMVANYEEKGSFIFADLLNPDHKK